MPLWYSSTNYSSLWSTLQSRVRFGVHRALVWIWHITDPHIELFTLRILRRLCMVLSAWKLACSLELHVIGLTSQSGIALWAIDIQERTIDRIKSKSLLLWVRSVISILLMRLMIGTPYQVVDSAPSNHRGQRLLVTIGLLIQLLGHFVYVAVPWYLELLLGSHPWLQAHRLDIIKRYVQVRQGEPRRNFFLGHVKHICVLGVRQPAVRAVEVLDEGIAAVASCLSRRLAPPLTLFLRCVVLAVADSPTFLTLQICLA